MKPVTAAELEAVARAAVRHSTPAQRLVDAKAWLAERARRHPEWTVRRLTS